jgi:lipid-A-disaccharide synthase
MKPPHIFMIAGEPSGDNLGAALIRGLRDLCGPCLRLEGIGGPAMAEAGFRSRFPMEELSVMGLSEILPRLPNLLRRIRETAEAVVALRPDALIGIDSPDFCLRVARRARRALPDLRVIHYVAPSVWAWRPGRAQRMATSVDHVLALLPFEPPYMRAAGMSCDFVGHPVARTPVATATDILALRAELGLGAAQQVLALLPGSRAGEVTRLAPIFSEVCARLARTHPELAVVIPSAAPVASLVAARFASGDGRGPIVLDPSGLGVEAAERRKRTAFAMADVALAASGTVSLELAAQGTPMVIAYGANPLTAAIVRRMVNIDTVTLVNLVTATRTVPEFLLGACRPEAIAPAVARILDDPGEAERQKDVANQAMVLLGRDGEDPGLLAARSVLSCIASPPRTLQA